jgi:hypothetical protein
MELKEYTLQVDSVRQMRGSLVDYWPLSSVVSQRDLRNPSRMLWRIPLGLKLRMVVLVAKLGDGGVARLDTGNGSRLMAELLLQNLKESFVIPTIIRMLVETE